MIHLISIVIQRAESFCVGKEEETHFKKRKVILSKYSINCYYNIYIYTKRFAVNREIL